MIEKFKLRLTGFVDKTESQFMAGEFSSTFCVDLDGESGRLVDIPCSGYDVAGLDDTVTVEITVKKRTCNTTE